jgi:hypothetical protein
MYPLIQIAKLLADVLARLPDDPAGRIEELLPRQ